MGWRCDHGVPQKAPVKVTYQGRPELIVLSVEDYALPRQNPKPAFPRADMQAARLKRIARNRMDAEMAASTP